MCVCVCKSVCVLCLIKEWEIAFLYNCVKKRECRIVYIVIIVVCLMVSSDRLYLSHRD